jgi:hypothetical protein
MLGDAVHRVFGEEFRARSMELLIGILPPPRTAGCRSLGPCRLITSKIHLNHPALYYV